MDRPKQVLIVCTGNICRSPMAVGLLRCLLHVDSRSARIVVSSAGTRALEGHEASRHAINVMAERDIDITHHRACQLRQSDVASSDLLLVMEERHRGSVLGLTGPEARYKTLLIAELVGEHSPIQDPYGLPLSAYAACAEELDRILIDGLASLLTCLGLP